MDALQIIRPELLTLSAEQFHGLFPYFFIFAGTLLTILASVFKSINPKWPVFLFTLFTCMVGILLSSDLIANDSVLLFNGMMVSDSFSNLFNVVFLGAAAITTLSSFRYLDHEKLQHPEYYLLLLFAALGMMLMVSALDLIVIFIALELMSLSVYVLVGFRRVDRKSNEAAMKYFILGSVASAVFLYGAALLYGVSGSTQVKEISAFVQSHPESVNPVFMLGVGLVLFGYLFKIASVPFHMWMPDVYEGAPSPITGFMTSGLKAAAFASFIRVLSLLGYGRGLAQLVEQNIHHLLWVSAVLTLILGNFVALMQTNLKRMLAYSSIAHTGYLLVGILSGPQSEMGMAPVVLYVIVYAIMNIGAFIILTLLASKQDTGLNLQDFSGLSRKHPWLAFTMAVFLFSMAGIPPTAGFAAKYLLFYSAVQANEIPLVIIGVLCSAVSVYYYLRVIVFMYMRDPFGSPAVIRVSIWSGFAVALMLGLTLQIGTMPSRIFELAKKAVTSLSI